MNPRPSGYAYTTPAIALIALFLLIPSLYGFYYSLFDIKYLQPTNFIGFDNYFFLLRDPALAGVLWRSAIFAAVAVTLTVALSLTISLWLNTLTGWFALLVQIVVILPWVISHVVGALLFRWVFVNDIGIGLYLLERIGISTFSPLTSPTAAMAVLVAYACWRTLGFTVIMLLAGLKAIPDDYYEAAQIDGANGWQQFRRITLPLLNTVLLITVVILTLSNLNTVEAPLIVTGGGPADATNIVPYDLYVRAFTNYDFNSAIALGTGMFIANILLTLAYVRLVKWNA